MYIIYIDLYMRIYVYKDLFSRGYVKSSDAEYA
jgi:hypothetical protein